MSLVTTDSIRRADDTRASSSAGLLRGEGFAVDREGLIAALQTDDPAVKAEAAFLLGRSRDAGAVEALKQALADESARVRVEAALALARQRDETSAFETLRRELDGAFFADAPLRAARALALLGDAAGYARVIEALGSEFPSNRMEAVAVLPAFVPHAGDGIDPVAALIEATSDVEAIVRSDALAALRAVDDPRAVEALRRADGPR